MKDENKPQWITTRVDDGIATVRLEREKVNALVPEVVEQLSVAANTIASDARAIILTGTGPFFRPAVIAPPHKWDESWIHRF